MKKLYYVEPQTKNVYELIGENEVHYSFVLYSIEEQYRNLNSIKISKSKNIVLFDKYQLMRFLFL